MKDTAPRIIKLEPDDNDLFLGLAMKPLFTPSYLQENIISGTRKYVNYPTSPENIKGFPWVLLWKGNNTSALPNLGPGLGFGGSSFLGDTIQPSYAVPTINTQIIV